MGELIDGKVVLGWREWVSLPDWGIKKIRAKIDTGARTSAIHVSEMEMVGEDRIRFSVVVRERPERRVRWVEAELSRSSRVKPSSGTPQTRPVVVTRMLLGGVECDIELSLVCREGMLCRMLVGRTAMEGNFFVDPAHRYLTRERDRVGQRESGEGL